eukprot:SAG11_NODE_35697_length_265_cov_0.933735_1_plen_31_part_01
MLMERLRETIAGTSADALLPQLFEGVYANTI